MWWTLNSGSYYITMYLVNNMIKEYRDYDPIFVKYLLITEQQNPEVLTRDSWIPKGAMILLKLYTE